MTASNIAVGIAGWSYPDWDGYVYPPGTRDKLRFVADFVDMVEINTTFYRPPSPKLVASWHQRTADIPDFFFAAKLNREVTHDQVIAPRTVDSFRTAFAPLVDAGRLKHLLAQFRWDFDDTPAHRRHIEQITRHYGPIAHVTLELRNGSWAGDEALTFLRGLGVSVANLDYPAARNGFAMRVTGIGEDAYLRLHGRNRKAWFSRGAGRDETYNYAYSEDELDDIADRAEAIASMSKTLTLVANNHYQGKEMLAAVELKAKLGGGKAFAPPDLVKKYPRIKTIARPSPRFPEQRELFE